MSVSAEDYATLSILAYKATPDAGGLASDFTFLTGSIGTGPMYAALYERGTERVIAFRGTDSPSDVPADLSFMAPINIGWMALKPFVDDIVANLPAGVSLSFTGHSLGGGLAAIAAATYDRPATVFDPAPYSGNVSVIGNGVERAQQNVDVYRVKGEILEVAFLDGIFLPSSPLAFANRVGSCS